MHVSQIMSRRPTTVKSDTHLDAVARTMLRKDIGSVIVVGEHNLPVGILTERDFTAREPANPFQKHRPPMLFGQNVRVHGLEQIYNEAKRLSAGRLARPFKATLREEDTIAKAVDLMNRHDVLHLPVLRDGKCVGMVSRHDLLRLAAASTWAA